MSNMTIDSIDPKYLPDPKIIQGILENRVEQFKQTLTNHLINVEQITSNPDISGDAEKAAVEGEVASVNTLIAAIDLNQEKLDNLSVPSEAESAGQGAAKNVSA